MKAGVFMTGTSAAPNRHFQPSSVPYRARQAGGIDPEAFHSA